MACNVFAQVNLTRTGYATDLEALSAWSGLFALATWLCAMLPLALVLDEDSRFLRPLAAWPFGALCGVLACALLLAAVVGRELFEVPAFYAQAALTGAVAWGTYAHLARSERIASAPGRWTAIGWLAAPLCIALFYAVVAPGLERLAPAFAFHYGTSAMRARVFERTLRELRVGDTLEDLRRRLPGEFEGEIVSTAGQIGANTEYSIGFEAGRITRIDVRTR